MDLESDYRKRTENMVFATAFKKAVESEEEKKTKVLKKYERTKHRKCNNAQRHNKRKR